MGFLVKKNQDFMGWDFLKGPSVVVATILFGAPTDVI